MRGKNTKKKNQTVHKITISITHHYNSKCVENLLSMNSFIYLY